MRPTAGCGPGVGARAPAPDRAGCRAARRDGSASKRGGTRSRGVSSFEPLTGPRRSGGAVSSAVAPGPSAAKAPARRPPRQGGRSAAAPDGAVDRVRDASQRNTPALEHRIGGARIAVQRETDAPRIDYAVPAEGEIELQVRVPDEHGLSVDA